MWEAKPDDMKLSWRTISKSLVKYSSTLKNLKPGAPHLFKKWGAPGGQKTGQSRTTAVISDQQLLGQCFEITYEN